MAETTAIGRTLDEVLAEAEASLASPAEVAAWERGQARRQRGEALALSGVGEVLSASGADAVVRDTVRPTRSIELVRDWLASPHPVLALFGSVGVGKTVAAAWALARVPGRYVEANALALARVSDFGRPSAWYQRTLRSELLVVDEVGTETDAASAVVTLHEVIDRRQRLPRRTLLLGNLDRETLVSRYDARTLDRLREVAVLRSVRGASLRGSA